LLYLFDRFTLHTMQSALLYPARGKCHNWDSKVYEEEGMRRTTQWIFSRESRACAGLFVCKIQYNKPTNQPTIFGLDLLVLFLLLLSNYHEWQNFANFWQDLSDPSILRGSLLKDRTRSGCSNYDQLGIQEVCLLGYCV
jgi:hypothetical protein